MPLLVVRTYVALPPLPDFTHNLLPSRLLVCRLARNEVAPTALYSRLLLGFTTADGCIVRIRLLQRNAQLAGRVVLWPLGRTVELVRIRIPRAHKRQPVRYQLRRERAVQVGLRLEGRRPVESTTPSSCQACGSL